MALRELKNSSEQWYELEKNNFSVAGWRRCPALRFSVASAWSLDYVAPGAENKGTENTLKNTGATHFVQPNSYSQDVKEPLFVSSY